MSGDEHEYIPTPIDTSGVKLLPELSTLTEILARSIHDVWALKRFAEGWSLGQQRDDLTKRHPGLVPYERLPDEEKEYDRATALETLKSILALGFSIIPSEAAAPFERTPGRLG